MPISNPSQGPIVWRVFQRWFMQYLFLSTRLVCLPKIFQLISELKTSLAQFYTGNFLDGAGPMIQAKIKKSLETFPAFINNYANKLTYLL